MKAGLLVIALLLFGLVFSSASKIYFNSEVDYSDKTDPAISIQIYSEKNVGGYTAHAPITVVKKAVVPNPSTEIALPIPFYLNYTDSSGVNRLCYLIAEPEESANEIRIKSSEFEYTPQKDQSSGASVILLTYCPTFKEEDCALNLDYSRYADFGSPDCRLIPPPFPIPSGGESFSAEKIKNVMTGEDPLFEAFTYTEPSYGSVVYGLTQRPSITTLNQSVCFPLIILGGLLLGALFVAGKNPFAAFDFTAPRLNRGTPYQMKTVARYYNFANLTGLVAAGSVFLSNDKNGGSGNKHGTQDGTAGRRTGTTGGLQGRSRGTREVDASHKGRTKNEEPEDGKEQMSKMERAEQMFQRYSIPTILGRLILFKVNGRVASPLWYVVGPMMRFGEKLTPPGARELQDQSRAESQTKAMSGSAAGAANLVGFNMNSGTVNPNIYPYPDLASHARAIFAGGKFNIKALIPQIQGSPFVSNPMMAILSTIFGGALGLRYSDMEIYKMRKALELSVPNALDRARREKQEGEKMLADAYFMETPLEQILADEERRRGFAARLGLPVEQVTSDWLVSIGIDPSKPLVDCVNYEAYSMLLCAQVGAQPRIVHDELPTPEYYREHKKSPYETEGMQSYIDSLERMGDKYYSASAGEVQSVFFMIDQDEFSRTAEGKRLVEGSRQRDSLYSSLPLEIFLTDPRTIEDKEERARYEAARKEFEKRIESEYLGRFGCHVDVDMDKFAQACRDSGVDLSKPLSELDEEVAKVIAHNFVDMEKVPLSMALGNEYLRACLSELPEQKFPTAGKVDLSQTPDQVCTGYLQGCAQRGLDLSKPVGEYSDEELHRIELEMFTQSPPRPADYVPKQDSTPPEKSLMPFAQVPEQTPASQPMSAEEKARKLSELEALDRELEELEKKAKHMAMCWDGTKFREHSYIAPSMASGGGAGAGSEADVGLQELMRQARES